MDAVEVVGWVVRRVRDARRNIWDGEVAAEALAVNHRVTGHIVEEVVLSLGAG